MNRMLLKKLIMIIVVCAISMTLILTKEQAGYAQNIKKKGGLNFKVPEDWPIEKRGGILAPISTEEYVSVKFKSVKEESQAMKKDLTDKIEELEQAMKSMKAEFTKKIQNAQLSDASEVESENDSAEILERLATMKIDSDRLDRKVRKKVADLYMKHYETVITVTTMEEKVKGFQTQLYKLDEEVDYILDKQEGTY